jgi:hypothetical protein
MRRTLQSAISYVHVWALANVRLPGNLNESPLPAWQRAGEMVQLKTVDIELIVHIQVYIFYTDMYVCVYVHVYILVDARVLRYGYNVVPRYFVLYTLYYTHA